MKKKTKSEKIIKYEELKFQILLLKKFAFEYTYASLHMRKKLKGESAEIKTKAETWYTEHFHPLNVEGIQRIVNKLIDLFLDEDEVEESRFPEVGKPIEILWDELPKKDSKRRK